MCVSKGKTMGASGGWKDQGSPGQLAEETVGSGGPLGMRSVYVCGSLRAKPQWGWLLEDQESPGQLCVYSLRGSYLQMPAAGETECLNLAAGWIHIMRVGVCQCVYVFCLCCLYLYECSVCISLLSMWPVLYICICDAYVFFVCVCLLGIHFSLGYRLDLGPWSCSSFSSLRFSNLT